MPKHFMTDFPQWMFGEDFIKRIASRYRGEINSDTEERENKEQLNHNINLHLLWECMDIIHFDEAWVQPGLSEGTDADDVLTDIMFRAKKSAWKRVIGFRLRAVSEFSGWTGFVFAQKLELISDKARKCPKLSNYLAGDLDVPVGVARRAAEICKFDANWFLWYSLLQPEPLGSLNDRARFGFPHKLFGGLSNDNLLCVVRGETSLRHIGIEAGAPSWADPYMIYAYIIRRDNKKRFAKLTNSLQSTPPGNQRHQ